MSEVKQLNEELQIILNEMAITYTGETLSVIVNPDDSRNLFNNEYFKVFHGSSFRKAKDLTRIRFRFSRKETLGTLVPR